MSSKIVKRRNVIVVGKTGAGKSTVCNQIIGKENFSVSSTVAGETGELKIETVRLLSTKENDTEYEIKVIDTVGFFDQRCTNSANINKTKTFVRDKVPDGISLVIFVFKQGRFTAEEKETFKLLIDNFQDEISDLSALVITNCEDMTNEGREGVIKDFKNSPETAKITSFMKKGLHPLGFPDLKKKRESLQSAYKEGLKEDQAALREIIMNCDDDLKLSRELYNDSWAFWKYCTIL